MQVDWIAADEFSSWLAATRENLITRTGASVPCGECTACCRSSQFVHIEPDETSTLARIPADLLFPAPGWPAGTWVLGYDRQGHCPMLRDNRCSIYEDRPRTCRNYDCRVFAVTGTNPSEDDKGDISARVERWKFDCHGPQAWHEYLAVQAAARFLHQHAAEFPQPLPASSTQLALLALKVYTVFSQFADPNEWASQTSTAEIVQAIVEASRAFDEGH
jgi:Fe-S-cluster containining protein